MRRGPALPDAPLQAEPMPDPVALLAGSARVRALASALEGGRRCIATGAVGSSTHLLAGGVARLTSRVVVLVTAHLDEADNARDELSQFGVRVVHLPALETLPGESGVSLDLLAARLRAVRALSEPASLAGPVVVVAPIQALMQGVPGEASLEAMTRTIVRGQRLAPGDLVRWLDGAGYTRVDAVEEPGDFALRGGILDIFPPSAGPASAEDAADAGTPVRLDFFGDDVDRITEIDLDTMGSDRAVERVELLAAKIEPLAPDARAAPDLLPRGCLVLLAETMEITEQARGYYERALDARGVLGPPATLRALQARAHAVGEINHFSSGAALADERVELELSPLPEFPRDPHAAVAQAAGLELGVTLIACQNEGELHRLRELLAGLEPDARARVRAGVAYLHRGFVWRDGDATALVPYHELMHRFQARRRAARLAPARAMDTFVELQVGDHVVHSEHGIAHFTALTLLKPRAPKTLPGEPKPPAPEPEEFLTLEFAGGSRLNVPAAQIDKVQKYVGGFSGRPHLSTLGGQRWKAQKDRVAESVKDLAAEMLRVRAARESMPGIRFPADTDWQREFEAQFPYQETDDQLAALGAIKMDMQRQRPMDRLICGDVGFGKTELAIRAAFKAVESGRQAAVLVPTTLLAEQHEQTFRARFAGYPFRVESISRFKTARDSADILAALRKGQVDIIIGTHRLLSRDVEFADLGLVVIDEEQRFGVEHKEQLLRLRLTADVLTLSATPIPRTLHMSMLGLRDISSLVTAPMDRQAVVTEVVPWNDRRIAQAIARELSRDGQVFFVHNRVHSIRSVADRVQSLAPGARIVVGHGQMPDHELEEVMLRFLRRQADILVSTTIIESGIDIPTANTMFIDDADRFGLSELHQLRGRVGRYKHRAYCYLLLPHDRAPSETATKRLRAIEQYSMLGAGFKIAMRDLEIRGAGNLLGPEQSGHIAAVGYDMYCRLLEHAVAELNHERRPDPPSSTSVEIGITGVIPKPYIPSDPRRLEAYRRLATAATLDDLAGVRRDLTQAYGEPPPAVLRLLELAELRVLAAGVGVRSVSVRGADVVFKTAAPDAVAERLHANAPPRQSGSVVALPPKSNESLAEVYFRPSGGVADPSSLLRVLRKRLSPPPTLTTPTTPIAPAVPAAGTPPRTAPVRSSPPPHPQRDAQRPARSRAPDKP